MFIIKMFVEMIVDFIKLATFAAGVIYFINVFIPT